MASVHAGSHGPEAPWKMGALAACFGGLLGCGLGQPGDERVLAPRGAGANPAVRCTAKPGAAGDSTVKVVSGGLERTAELHVPPSYDPTKGSSLALVFHFAGGSPVLMAQSTSLGTAANARGFLLAYPAGIGGSWNAGRCCGEAWKKGIDDVQFTRDLLDAIGKEYCVDPRRVFATGMSNGALLTERLGRELSDRLAAIAPVAGVLDLDPRERPRGAPARPVSILAFHGTADTWMPYGGGPGNPPIPLDGDLNFLSVAQNMAAWRRTNGCSERVEPGYRKGDATCVAWPACARGTAAVLCTIEGGGHTWPGGHLPAIFGKTSDDIDASNAILDFFGEHRRD